MQSEGQKKRFAFNKRRLDCLPIPGSGRQFVYDSKVPSLALCVTEAGSKTFVFYKWGHGRPIRLKLGTFPEMEIDAARDLAVSYADDIARGKDPAAERRALREVPTLRKAFEHWLATYAKLHKRTWKDDERQFNKYLADFHDRRLNTIKPSEVARWHGGIGEKNGPIQANRTLALLATVFNAADKVGFSGKNPCDGVKRFREQSRDRFLQPQEMRAFFESVEAEEQPWRDYFLLLLFTGQRRGNVAGMAWADVDLHQRTWRIPLAKNGRPHFVPLVGPAFRILEERAQQASGSPWVFPAMKGSGGHVVEPKRAWAKVLERAGLTDLRLHDLRRSLGSWEAAAGTAMQIIGATLGHRDLRSTAVYSRLSLDPVRDAMTQATQAMIEAGKPAEPKQEGKADGVV